MAAGRRTTLRTTATAGALCAVLSLGAAPAAARTETASKGNVTATLSYEGSAGKGFHDVRVRVARGGVELVDDPGPRFPKCSERCEFAPLGAFAGTRSIFLRNLDPDPEPEVLAEFYSGGANCCAASRIYDFVPTRGRYARIGHNWKTGNHRGALDLDHDGAAELVSSDWRFEFRFGCGTCTPEPVRIFSLRDGRLLDVTRRFPKPVRVDLLDLRRTYRKVHKDRFAARGVLAALVADRYLLGQGKTARRALSRALARGDLRGARGDGVPDGRAYVRALLRFLRRTGYRR